MTNVTPNHSSTASHDPVLDLSLFDEAKRRAQEQWSANPCGAHVARDFEFGTRAYFDAIEQYRYGDYASWMAQVIGFDKHRGKTLLEIGCGTGTDLLQFARAGAIVTGIDLTPKSIEIARRRFDVYEATGAFSIGDAESLSFSDESFDVVYSFGVLHHTPKIERAVAEIHRVLRGGGQTTVMLYNRSSLYYWGALILKRGLLRGELLRSSPADIMSRYAEYSEAAGRPLVRAYSHREARRLFRAFSKCRIQVNQLTRDELGLAGRLLPDALFNFLARTFGWNLIITAIK